MKWVRIPEQALSKSCMGRHRRLVSTEYEIHIGRKEYSTIFAFCAKCRDEFMEEMHGAVMRWRYDYDQS